MPRSSRGLIINRCCLGVRQAEAQLQVARADYLPTLSVGANATMSSGTIGGAGGGLDVTTQTLPGLLVSGTLGLNWPILTGLSTVYAVRDAQAQLALARANLQQLRRRCAVSFSRPFSCASG